MNNYFISFPLNEHCEALTTTTALGNMAYQVDNGQGVKEHRLLLANALNISIDKLTFVHQSHSDTIKEVTIDDVGKGLNSFEDGLECDALYTRLKGVPLGVFHADCVPIFFIDQKQDLVGIIHAGFKGTMKHITYKVIKEIIAKENINKEDLLFYIGPFRMKQSFVVDEESKKAIIEAGFISTIEDNHFDNGLANVLDLYKLGIKDSQIKYANLDTVTNDRFYSAYLKTPIGRMVSLIYLK